MSLTKDQREHAEVAADAIQELGFTTEIHENIDWFTIAVYSPSGGLYALVGVDGKRVFAVGDDEVGDRARSLIKKIGFGDYEVEVNGNILARNLVGDGSVPNIWFVSMFHPVHETGDVEFVTFDEDEADKFAREHGGETAYAAILIEDRKKGEVWVNDAYEEIQRRED